MWPQLFRFHSWVCFPCGCEPNRQCLRRGGCDLHALHLPSTCLNVEMACLGSEGCPSTQQAQHQQCTVVSICRTCVVKLKMFSESACLSVHWDLKAWQQLKYTAPPLFWNQPYTFKGLYSPLWTMYFIYKFPFTKIMCILVQTLPTQQQKEKQICSASSHQSGSGIISGTVW